MLNPSRHLDDHVDEATLLASPYVAQLWLEHLGGPRPGCSRDGEHMVSVDGTASQVEATQSVEFWKKKAFRLI